jgi:hypothetical protein
MHYKVVLLASAEQDLMEIKAYALKDFSMKTWKSTFSKKGIHSQSAVLSTGRRPR